MLLQELAIVMKQCCNSVLGQDIIANLLLHEAKLLCNVFLQNRGRREGVITNSQNLRKYSITEHSKMLVNINIQSSELDYTEIVFL